MAGDGPDLIVLDRKSFPDSYKAMQSGIFDDLNPYIKHDEAFNLVDYNEKVLEAGVCKDKRYTIPMNYYVPMLQTTKEILKEERLPQDLNLPYTEYLTTLKSFSEEKKQNPFSVDENIGMLAFFPWGGIELIDNETNKINKDAMQGEYLKNVLEAYKSMYSYGEAYSGGYYDLVKLQADKLRNQEALFIFAGYTPSHAIQPHTAIRAAADAEPVTMFIKSVDNETVACVGNSLSIRANSENKANAYNLMKILLSEEIQQSFGIGGVPVLKGAFQEPLEWEYNDYVRYFEEDISRDLINSDIADYFNLAENVDKAVFYRSRVTELLLETMKPYLEGKKSYEQCLAEFENKLELYAEE